MAADANTAAMTPFWFDLITVIDDLDYNLCFQMSFDFEPHKFHSCMKIVSPSRFWKKRIKTYRRKHFDPDLHLSDIPCMAAALR